MMRLDQFENSGFVRGRPRWVEAVWVLLGSPLLASWLPGSRWRCVLLRWFGATIGQSVVCKPGLRVKFPWRLKVGDFSWLGESAWIDNLGSVTIGQHCCISQGAYLCTGSHDWSATDFALKVDPIVVEDGAWIAAFSRIAPGVVIGSGAVVQLGAVVYSKVAALTRVAGNPARPVGNRVIGQ